MTQYIIEICPHEPRASIMSMTGADVSQDDDIADCRASGDCEPACEYVRDSLGVEFRIVARDASGKYENRLASDAEMQATCEAIYFESDSDFTDRDTCATYLIWDAAQEVGE
jgi:hypothetical protein